MPRKEGNNEQTVQAFRKASAQAQIAPAQAGPRTEKAREGFLGVRKMIPTWVFLAVPMGLLALVALMIERINNWRERRILHAVFDGDRMQSERAWFAHKHNRFGGFTFEQYEVERRYY
jgi:heme exporter protein D